MATEAVHTSHGPHWCRTQPARLLLPQYLSQGEFFQNYFTSFFHKLLGIKGPHRPRTATCLPFLPALQLLVQKAGPGPCLNNTALMRTAWVAEAWGSHIFSPPKGTEWASTDARTVGPLCLILLMEGSRINLLRSKTGVLPSIAVQCLAQHPTQCLQVLDEELLRKEPDGHKPGLSSRSCLAWSHCPHRTVVRVCVHVHMCTL